MKKEINVFFVLLPLLFFLITAGCTNDTSQAEETASKAAATKPVNIIVIIDTSDRIAKAKNPGQAKKDIAITENIVTIFEERFVRPQLYIGSNHTVAFVVPEQPNVPPVQTEILRNLKIWPTLQQKAGGAPQFKIMKTELLTALNGLYQSVDKQTEFTGSDIWKWFKESAQVYLKPDASNYIICLSDGYLDFNHSIQRERPKGTYIPYTQVAQLRDTPNWKQKFHTEKYGLLEISGNFSRYDTKFLMIEMTPRHMLDLDIVKEYWQTWLASMGITDTEFLPTQADPLIVVEQVKRFLTTQ